MRGCGASSRAGWLGGIPPAPPARESACPRARLSRPPLTPRASSCGRLRAEGRRCAVRGHIPSRHVPVVRRDRPARVLPTGAPTAGLGRGALSGGGTRGVPGRQEWRGRRQADLRAGGAGGIPPSHPAREDAPYAAATPPLSWVSRRCPASRKRPGASAALFGGEADLANTKARAGCPAHPAARCQSAARCDGRSARAFADARTVPPKNDADWMARCHTVPPRLSIPDFATLSLFNEIKSHPTTED